MKRIILLLFLHACSSAAREPNALVEDLDRLAEQARKAWNVPGCAVIVVRDGKTLLLKGFGVKELGRNDPVTPTTIFGIGSLTKAVATTALAKLVEEKKLRWD